MTSRNMEDIPEGYLLGCEHGKQKERHRIIDAIKEAQRGLIFGDDRRLVENVLKLIEGGV